MEISYKDFAKIDIRVGTVIRAEVFPGARKPAFKLWVDFGAEIGERKTSAQITKNYQPEKLIGCQVAGVVNFPAKKIGPFISECLVTGFYSNEKDVVLATTDKNIENGLRLV